MYKYIEFTYRVFSKVGKVGKSGDVVGFHFLSLLTPVGGAQLIT